MESTKFRGLKKLRSKDGPQKPNDYWQRPPANKCRECQKRIRGTNHEEGAHHIGGNVSKRKS